MINVISRRTSTVAYFIGSIDMFFSCCKKPEDQEPSSSSGEAGKEEQSTGKSRRKTFLKLWTRLCMIFSCQCRKPSKQSEENQTSNQSGKTFKDKKWSTVKELGEGAFGKVFLLKNESNDELVAKKEAILNPNDESFMSEAIIHFQMKHVNIINLHCWERVDNKLTLFMEYCSGGDIKSNIDRIKGKEALNYFSQLMDGVAYLHSRGVAHRDLKPENLLLTAEKVLKIADLGLAEVFLMNGEEVQLTGTVGSRAFMAPEVIKGPTYYGPPIDLWSSGVVYFNLTTKGRPWEQATPEDKIYKMWHDKDEELNTLIPWCWLSESCRSVVDILLEPDPRKRLSGWKKHRQG
ncbi:serine/threonine-protein kinase Chk1-like [Oratosquilla oratoria]|uniref:serine/threonine-protein kinase Chk1-like n=1 Tax=Oratosquilla oratoria TaxID=337810 RepID=UPI003F7775B4